ncbi:MAG: 3',5'-cyclic-AMP phosphodiesterase [Leptolyngbya sp. BL-A-14]
MSVLSALRLVQLTDLHLFADGEYQLLGLPTTESFQAVLHQVSLLQPQPNLLLLTGDLSQDGKPESYKRLHTALQLLGYSTYWLPGNHDRLLEMEECLAGGVISAQKSFQIGGWHFILLNSQVPGCVHGQLTGETLEWLEHQLNLAGELPTLVSLHHPPFTVGSDWLDSSTLQNPEALFTLLDQYPQVKLVLFGHIHQEYSRIRRGVQYLGTPSTSIQFEPYSSLFALDEEQPGFRILDLYPDGNWWTTVVRSGYVSKCDLAATGY